jgi:SAM-dependent methyltransferase
LSRLTASSGQRAANGHPRTEPSTSYSTARYPIACPICGPDAPFAVKYPEHVAIDSLDFAARKLTRHMHWRMVVCQGCGLIYSNPIIAPEVIEALYQRADFVDEAQLHNMGRDYLAQVQRYRSRLLPNPRLLEVGCANGFFLELVAQAGITEAWGVDPGRAAVNLASPAIRPRIINDFLREGMFREASFDLVCSFQVFDHILYPNEFLTLIRHYLKPGGLFIQIHHNIHALHPSILGRRASTYDVEHIHLWSRRTMRLILEKNQLEPITLSNIATAYKVDYVLRQLPLRGVLKASSRAVAISPHRRWRRPRFPCAHCDHPATPHRSPCRARR